MVHVLLRPVGTTQVPVRQPHRRRGYPARVASCVVGSLLALALLTGVSATAQQAGGSAGGSGSDLASAGAPEADASAATTQALVSFLNRGVPPKIESLEAFEAHWETNLVPFILDSLTFVPQQDPRHAVLWKLLRKKAGESMPRDGRVWQKWLWKQEYTMHPDFPEFRAALYSSVDRRFRWWFFHGMPHTIRVDEIMWGGVKVDGIPPLEHPKVIPAAEADYLGKKNIVFGIYVNGEARAYPKRILAWHEMANDTVAGVDVTLVYCTLCGSAILYDQHIGERRFVFGTSGFLYRSNKLMYDRETRSLWSALEGRPVTGKLAGTDLVLKRLPIVTTTWEEWRRRHPDTTVLSLETGHRRDYGEGVAYREYFATDQLMFNVPFDDDRLKNKQEILAVVLDRTPAAFDTKFLRKNPLHHDTVGRQAVVILTDKSGANRVYDARGMKFQNWDGKSNLTDEQGVAWQVTEDALQGPDGKKYDRLAAHRAFWFGWHAQFPNVRLVR